MLFNMILNHSQISKRQLTNSLTTTEFLTKCDEINKLQMQFLTTQEHNDYLIYTPVPGTLNILKNVNMCTLLLLPWCPCHFSSQSSTSVPPTARTSTHYTWQNEQQCSLQWKCDSSSSKSWWCNLTWHSSYISHMITVTTLAEAEAHNLTTVYSLLLMAWTQSCWPNARYFMKVILLYIQYKQIVEKGH